MPIPSRYTSLRKGKLQEDIELGLLNKNPEEVDFNKIVNGVVRNFIFETLSAKTTMLEVFVRDDGKQLESVLGGPG